MSGADLAALRAERDTAEAAYREARRLFVEGKADDGEKRRLMDEARDAFDAAVAALARAELGLREGQ